MTPEQEAELRDYAEEGTMPPKRRALIQAALDEIDRLKKQLAKQMTPLEKGLRRALLPGRCPERGCGMERFRTTNGSVCANGHEAEKQRDWTCGKSPSVGVETIGCGTIYERPPRRKRRRGERVNEARTTTCPSCGHIDALYSRSAS